MRVSQEEKDRSHARIIEAAARLLRERGIESTSVADVMSAAGMSHGGFYRHFPDKDGLVAAALQAGFDEMMAGLEERLGQGDAPAAVAAFEAYYLSKGHVEQPGCGCPVAALAGDVRRGLDALKAVFGAGVSRMLGSLARGLPGTNAQRRIAAARELAMMVGAVAIARASDPDTARAVLAACRPSSARRPAAAAAQPPEQPSR